MTVNPDADPGPLDIRRPGAWLAAALIVVAAAAAALAIIGRVEIANLVLTVVVVVLTALTYWWLTPTPARLVVLRPDELEFSDLLFFTYAEPPLSTIVPRDVLLQLHVVVVNFGGRKGLLSSLRLLGLLDDHGALKALPEFPKVLGAHLYSQVSRRRASRNMQPETESETQSLPLVLGPDDVVLLRFRARRGIDWSAQWTLDRLKAFHDALAEPIVSARLELVFRRGRDVVRQVIEVPCVVEQQAAFRDALATLTKGFEMQPAVDPRAIAIE